MTVLNPIIRPPQRLTREQAANYIGVTCGTLDVWRCTGRHGVPFVRIGRKIYYLKDDLDMWLDSRRVTPLTV